MAAFREEAARGGVCVAREEALRAAPTDSEVDAALLRLAGGPRVAVCWCEGRTARALLAGQARAPHSPASAPLRLVASDGWADRRDVVAGLEHVAHHSLTLRIRSPYLRHFDAYYHSLKPHTNHRNPWFKEFWEQKFNCTLEEGNSGKRKCTGSESLTAGYTQEPKLALVVRGVYTLAHALHDMRGAVCGASQAGAGLCAAMLPFNVSLYRRYIARVRFRAPDGGIVAFDSNGDPPPELSEYDVMNLVSDGAGGWRYVRVGRWRRGALRLHGGHAATARRASGVRAACSQECGAGSWARRSEGERARCCWTCVPCATLAVTAPAGCRLCPPGHRPDALRKECIPSPIEWGGGGRWARAVSLAAGGGGLAAVCVCAATFWRHRATPVVKSASRELCALLLCAAAACHCAALAAVARPAPTVCAAVRLAAPALGGVYAAVLARTVRVARLVQAAERRPAARPRLLSSRAQVWTWAALSGPGVATAAWSALRWPATPQLLHPGRARAVLVCGGELAPAQLVPLAPALALLASCVALAIRTRRLPHNFNETKFVGAAAYATCVTWVAFFPLYAATEARTATLCACVSLSAGACVALSLGPRVWVCVFRPERNTRAHFLTATSIRCHLGKYRPGSDAPAGSLNSPRKCAELRDASCQVTGDNNSDQRSSVVRCVERGDAGAAGGWCEASGVCARVTRIPATAEPAPARAACDPDDADATDVADVLIVLFHHRHALHSPLLETANKNHANSEPI